MIELVKYIAEALVDNPECVKVTGTQDELGYLIRLQVASEDMGKVIGRKGRIAKAIRTVVKAASSKNNRKVNVQIISDEEVKALKEKEALKNARKAEARQPLEEDAPCSCEEEQEDAAESDEACCCEEEKTAVDEECCCEEEKAEAEADEECCCEEDADSDECCEEDPLAE